MNLALVCADDAGDKTEAQPQSFLRVRIGYAIEAIKDVRQVAGRDTHTGILHHELDAVSRQFNGRLNPSSRRRVFDGIG